jgi:hypothetical protein
MKIAVIYFGRTQNNRAETVSRRIAWALEGKGHTAHLINGFHDVNVNITMYESVTVGISSLWDILFPSRDLTSFFSKAGILVGKICYLFHPKFPLIRVLSKRLTAFLEHEGMILADTFPFSIDLSPFVATFPALTEKNWLGSVTYRENRVFSR